MSREFLRPEFIDLKKEYDAVVQCNRCGFCETSCPTYVATGKETLSPRGRNQAFRQILEGKMKDPARAAEIFSTCLTCHACTSVCFAQVPVGRLMGTARQLADAGRPLSRLNKAAARFFLARRRLLSLALGFGMLLKKLGLAALLKKSGLLKLVSPPLAAAEELVPNASLAFGGRPQGKPGNPGGPHAAYFSGCGIHWLYPATARKVVRLLEQNSSKLSCPSHACCGLAAQSLGDPEGARRLARQNIAQFEALGADCVVVDDDSCCGFMKSYPALLDGDPKAASFAKKVKDLAEFLEEKGWQAEGRKAVKTTYHDPCQMGNGQGLTRAPREILKRCGADFVELEESAACCGGAGTYCLKHPALADEVLERKLAHIRKSGAAVVVTQASSCLLHVGYGFRKKGWDGELRVLHLADFLSEREEKD